VHPNIETFVRIMNAHASLSACVGVGAHDDDKYVHEHIIECSLESNVIIVNS
jgi:hypothetical protein